MFLMGGLVVSSGPYSVLKIPYFPMTHPRFMCSVFLLFFLGIFTKIPAQSLQQKIDELVNHPGLKNASIGIDVMNLTTGERLAAHQPQRALIPASTLKLVTTATALKLLGPQATFKTVLATDGTLKNGVLEGNLFIIGGGDPTLASPYLTGALAGDELMEQWKNAVLQAGIHTIKGAVIADDGYYGTDGVGSDWPWSDLGNYYGAGSYGLNWHENFYFLDFLQRQRPGEVVTVLRTRPEIPGLRLHNEIRTGARGSGDNAYIYGAPFNFDNYLRGTIPPGTGRFTIRGSIPDPPLFVAQLLAKALVEAGVKVVLPATSSRAVGKSYSGTGKVLHEHRSPALQAIVERTNQRSNNLYAETLLREINKSRGIERHQLSSTEFMLTYLRTELGINTEGIQLMDGSGLSTRNFISPAFMTAFLRTQASNETFVNSLSVAGKTGNMSGRLKGTDAEGRLYVKSGSVNGVRCYAGYAFPRDGRRLAFSIMVNNYTLADDTTNTLLLELMRLLCKSN